ncbi:MAG: glycosyltransferase family 2 protein [Thermodesulfobacteriota bacterium]
MTTAPTPTVSIVIPTYNHAKVLQHALQSVLDQTYTDWEAIVINNFSADNTIEVVESFRDPRIRLINFSNQGVIAASRNVGIKAAQGDYVAFLDSDDTWYPNKLEKAMEIFRQRPDVDLVCHDVFALTQGRITRTIRAGHEFPRMGTNTKLQDYLLFQGNHVATSTVVVRKAKLEEVGGFRENREIISVEDYDLWIRLSAVSKFYFLNLVLGEYCDDITGLSKNVDLHHGNLEILLKSYFSEALKIRPSLFLKWKIRRRLASVYRGAAKITPSQEQRKECIIKMLQTYPIGLKNLVTTAWWLGKLLSPGRPSK